jgi:hypothetical protein
MLHLNRGGLADLYHRQTITMPGSVFSSSRCRGLAGTHPAHPRPRAARNRPMVPARPSRTLNPNDRDMLATDPPNMSSTARPLREAGGT